MLKLRNVSKFYYSKGIISSGFTKINLELNRGEFVAITGESGSGKSTLLNVISGLDSYEEGEMYVDGEDTSTYTEKDFEIYRRKYISNIFQSFNLINSYTVYQNVEIALLINGYKKKEYRDMIFKVLKRVGLYKYRNTKASKLSGGQKQRVAIARALVKNTPIIVADEPTGNLDVKSAEKIIKLLSNIAKDKLVIVVTHNYEQVEKYVTRKITMHDGQIVEDIRLNEASNVSEEGMQTPEAKFKKMRLFSKLKIGMRNTFNIATKFALLLFIFMFITVSVTSFYSTKRRQDYHNEMSGYNYYFETIDDKRIVLKRNDLTPFTQEDFLAIEAMDNIESIFEDDLLLDRSFSISNEMTWLNGRTHPISEYSGDKLDYGKMPENDNEVVILLSSESYVANDKELITSLLNSEAYLRDDSTGESISEKPIIISGIKIIEKEKEFYFSDFYISDYLMGLVRNRINASFSTTTINVNNYELQSSQYEMANKLIPVSWLAPGAAIVSEDWDGYFSDGKCIGKSFNVTVSNLYYSKQKTFTITEKYREKNFESVTGMTDYYWNNGVILVNSETYKDFFNNGSYQISVFLKDPKQAEETLGKLREMNFTPLYIKDALRTYDGAWRVINDVLETCWYTVLVLALFVISYFIIKLIMRSRNVYFSTIRMLGATQRDCNHLITIDLITVLNIAYLLVMGLLYAVDSGQIQIQFIANIVEYLTMKDYIVLYAIMLFISFVISQKYAKQLFKSTAMNTYREEL